MQYVNLGWILVQKTKQNKKNIWNRTYQEQSGKLSMEWILDNIWELLWIFLTLITECDYVRMSFLLGYTSICCKTGIKRHDVCNLLSNDSEKQHIYIEIWLIIKLMNPGDRSMYYSFDSSTYPNTYKSLGETLHHLIPHLKLLPTSLLCCQQNISKDLSILSAIRFSPPLLSWTHSIRFLSQENLHGTSSWHS